MRTTEAARYARWSAAVAILLSLIVAGVYTRRRLHIPTVQDATSVPASVQQETAEFSLSKVEGDHTQFTVRASHATEYKEGGRSLLEDVWVTSYGDSGQRFDNLHTRSCEYVAATGFFTCGGDVQIDLQASGDAGSKTPGTKVATSKTAIPASLQTPGRVIHIRTSKLTFDSKTGVAATQQPVEFNFPQGQGHAVGFHLESRQGKFSLLHDVHMRFLPSVTPIGRFPLPGTAAATGAEQSGPIEENISSSSMIYSRDERVIHMLGPVEANRGTSTLRAPRLDVELDADNNVQRVVASDRPQANGVQDGNPVSLSADQIVAALSSAGWIERITAVGNVQSDAKRADGQDRMTARQMEFEYLAGKNQLHRMTATDNVAVQSDLTSGASRHMTTASLVVDFGATDANGQPHPERATTPAATLDEVSPPPPASKTGVQRLHLTSNQLDAAFTDQGQLRELHGQGGVEVRRQVGDAAPMTGTSRELLAQFAPDGEWSIVEQNNDVHLHQADKTLETPHVRFEHSNETATLAGPITLTDASSRTTARSGRFVQTTNEFRADGEVVTSETSSGTSKETPAGGASAGNGTHGPSRISADHLVANTMTQHAVYSQHARVWQGDSVIEADTVELDRDAQTLTAIGSVRAVFPGAQPMPPSGAPAPPKQPAAGARQFIHAEAGRLTYMSNEHRAHLEQSPKARTAQGSIRSTAMDLFFTPDDAQGNSTAAPKANVKGGSAPGAAQGSPAASLGDQSLERAVALGDVLIDGDDRHAKAARADYTPADGKFVLSGEHPTVYDGSGNAANGRQLTFVFGDDRIVVDSEEGSRTLTLHRIEK